MQLQSISVQHVCIGIIVLCALVHFLSPLIGFTCGSLLSRCLKKKSVRSDIHFCQEQSRYWRWKLRFFAPEGQHADILMTMIELGEKNFVQFNALIHKESHCTSCENKKAGSTEIDRATRAFRSAQNIRKQCSFRLALGGPT